MSPVSRSPKPPRKALSHQGGETVVAGEPQSAELLADAMDVAEVSADALTHGFHSYPARMHFAIARRALSAFCPTGGRVLDPFCGSGTTLVEARMAGLEAWGTDLNPLGVALAQLKASRWSAAQRKLLHEAALSVAQASEARVRSRAEARAQLPRDELRWYAPHILKELAGLFEEIQAVQPEPVRRALTLVFSALVVKFSSQRSDTSQTFAERRLRKGLPTEFFLRKSEELVERLEALEPLLHGRAAHALVADARDVDRVTRGRFDLVLSSPPYGGTYDYVEHHRRRFAWLGYDDSALEQGEIGARRHGDEPSRFEHQLLQVLRSCRRVLAPDGKVVLLIGDGEAAGRRVPADELLERLAPQAWLQPVALASQPRPDFAGGVERMEHLLLLQSDGRTPPEREDTPPSRGGPSRPGASSRRPPRPTGGGDRGPRQGKRGTGRPS